MGDLRFWLRPRGRPRYFPRATGATAVSFWGGGRRLKSGDWAWLALGAGIVAYEIVGSEYLSEAYDRYVDRFPVLARAAPMILTLHVTNMVDERFDLVSWGFKALERLRGK